ncbi:MAG: ZIP family metal transporter [Clostridia bacterium]|nr:ZIP family metal transporter [Clostridia bacterium]
METIWWVIIITSISGVVGTGLGGVIGAIFKKDSSKVVSLLLSFAGGVMLAVVCFDLIPEAMHIEDEGSNLNVWLTIVGIVLGYGIVFGLNKIIDIHTKKEVEHVSEEDHPKTHDALDELIHADHLTEHRKTGTNKQLFIAGIVMSFAIALHNVPEGMVIGASYAKDASSLVAGGGFILAIIIGLHNIPEGMAVSVPLITGGMKKWVAIVVTAVTGIPTIIGAIIGYYVGALSPVGLTISLSFASGAMLYVVLGELLPEAYLMFKSKLPALFILIGVLVGVALVQI